MVVVGTERQAKGNWNVRGGRMALGVFSRVVSLVKLNSQIAPDRVITGWWRYAHKNVTHDV
jgi:hypothetical protein